MTIKHPVLSTFKTNSLNEAEAVHSLTVSTMSVKKPKGTRGSGSSRKKSFRAPVMTWMSSQSHSSKFSFSSETPGGGEQRMRSPGRDSDRQSQRTWTKGKAVWKRATRSSDLGEERVELRSECRSQTKRKFTSVLRCNMNASGCRREREKVRSTNTHIKHTCS